MLSFFGQKENMYFMLAFVWPQHPCMIYSKCTWITAKTENRVASFLTSHIPLFNKAVLERVKAKINA
ncbi:hypothetical protein FKM82_002017 [Ascaphus truei]